jgi:small subunit ribosomal protein S19e
MKVEEVCPVIFIAKLAKHLEEDKNMSPPMEADYIKTSHARERPPVETNWYYTRAASILRKLYMEEVKHPKRAEKGKGVTWFAKAYGTSKNNGHKPSHRVEAARGLLRRALQSLESMDYVARTSLGARRLSNTGVAELEAIARRCEASSHS